MPHAPGQAHHGGTASRSLARRHAVANFRPQWPFVMNRTSRQAKDLMFWWAPTNNMVTDLITGERASTNTRAEDVRGDIHAPGSFQSGTGMTEIKGWPDLSQKRAVPANRPYTQTVLTIHDTSQSFSSAVSSSTANFSLGEDNAGNIAYTGINGQGWQDDGPAIRSGELILIAVVLRSATDWTLHQVSASGGHETVTHTRNLTNSAQLFKPIIGSDRSTAGRGWRGSIFDTRFYNRALSNREIRELWSPRTRWDLYRPIQRITRLPVAAAGGSSIPVFMHHYKQMRAAA